MRDIKFRVWNSKKEIMENKSALAFNKNGVVLYDYEQLMQYTGLKDKNGVEIYEGDYMQDGHSGRWAEVKFINGAFVVEFDNEIQDLYDWTYECIIGNIYENKELLND